MAPKRAMDGRVRVADHPGDQPRAPAGSPPQLADPLLLCGGQLVRRALRAARAVTKAGERAALASAAASQRWRHLWAVADETLKSLAAARIDIPASIALQSSWRAASPSFALG
jgi:hypothetical protein